MEKIITKEAVRAHPAFKRLIKKAVTIAILKRAQRFEYKNTVYNDRWIFWMVDGAVVASAITNEFGASLIVHRCDGPGIIHNDGYALALVHLGTLAERSEGKDSGTWAPRFTGCGVGDKSATQLDDMYRGYAEP